MIAAASAALAFLIGALWRRVMGGWRPLGIRGNRAALFVALGFAGGLSAYAGGYDWWSILLGVGLTLSYAPAHGPDSNYFAFIKNDWVELPLRYGILPGVVTSATFAFLGNYIGAVVMLAGSILAGLAYAFFRHYGERLTWLPVDPSPHSIVDGRQVYNEFFLGGIPCAALVAALFF